MRVYILGIGDLGVSEIEEFLYGIYIVVREVGIGK